MDPLGTHKLLYVQGITSRLKFIEGMAQRMGCVMGNEGDVDKCKCLENVPYKSYIEITAQEGS